MNERPAWFAILLSVAFAASIALGIARVHPPSPRPADIPIAEFSAQRASDTLRRVSSELPHPSGTAENAIVRERIVTMLRALGLSPQIQKATICNASGTCADAINIVTEIEGRQGGGKAVLVAVHYDSVAAGPGAGDDGSGVAIVLEAARALRALGPQQNPIILLIDDGEEAGLLGAEAFARKHPRAREIGAVVNLEARGTSGPSFMFETSHHNRWLVDIMRQSVKRPLTSSLFYFVYERLPNDTDLTVFKRTMEGVNFAFIGDVSHYHTPLDRLSNLDLGTLQHQGDNAFAMILAFANADLRDPPRGQSVYFDLFGWTILSWPLGATVPLAIFNALLFVAALALMIRASQLTSRELATGAVIWIVALSLTAIVAWATSLALKGSGAFQGSFGADTLYARALYWIIPWLILSIAAAVSTRWTSRAHLIVAAAFWISLLSLAISFAAPFVSYITLVPSIVMNVGLLIASLSRRSGAVHYAGLPASIAAVAVIAPLGWALYDAMGLPLFLPSAILIFIMSAGAFPSISPATRKGQLAFSGAIGTLFILILAIAVTRAPYSAESPQKINIHYHFDSDRLNAQWLLSSTAAIPRELESAASWSIPKAPIFPWHDEVRYRVAPAPFAHVTPTPVRGRKERLSPDRNLIRLSIDSSRLGRLHLYVADSGRLLEARINGEPVPFERPSAQVEEWRRLAMVTPRPAHEIELIVRGDEPLEIAIEEVTYGLPLHELLSQKRPLTAVQSGLGDTSIVLRRIRV